VDYESYLREFNSAQDKEALLRWYAPDAIIEGPAGVTSLDAFAEQLRDARDGVRVTAVPRTVLGDEHRLMAELDITFFVVYELRSGVIVRFARAFWRVS
jgi:hypothetical protein